MLNKGMNISQVRMMQMTDYFHSLVKDSDTHYFNKLKEELPLSSCSIIIDLVTQNK